MGRKSIQDGMALYFRKHKGGRVNKMSFRAMGKESRQMLAGCAIQPLPNVPSSQKDKSEVVLSSVSDALRG
jgi:hypothetical protein